MQAVFALHFIVTDMLMCALLFISSLDILRVRRGKMDFKNKRENMEGFAPKNCLRRVCLLIMSYLKN